MKIAMIGQRGVPATFGGVERHVEELGARLAADGHEVVVFCRRGYGESEPERYRGMRLVHQHTVDSQAPGVVRGQRHGHGSHDRQGLRRRALPRRRAWAVLPDRARGCPGARVVQTIHGLDGERAKWGRGASALLRFGTWLSARVPDRTIVVSKALQEAYRDRYDRETVHIVNGTPEVTPRPAAAITERWGLTRGSYVLSVGRLVPEKAPEHLLAAFAERARATRGSSWPAARATPTST